MTKALENAAYLMRLEGIKYNRQDDKLSFEGSKRFQFSVQKILTEVYDQKKLRFVEVKGGMEIFSF